MNQNQLRAASSRVRSWRAHVAAGVMSVLLAACGGGGGSAPSPAVTIQSSATSTTASGATVTLTASLANSTSTALPTWSLSGPGSLSATSGASTTYTPPDSEDDANDGGLTAVVTVSVAGLSQTQSIQVAAKAFPGYHWTLAGQPIASWDAVAYANGLFVAGGLDGAIATSPDGSTWTRHDTGGSEEWNSVVASPTGWWLLDVVNGGFLTSTDGLTWTSKPLPAAAAGIAVAKLVYANGIYVLLGYQGGTVASTDGINWTKSSVTGAAITYGNGVFVVTGGTSGMFWSADGVTWTAASGASTDLDEVGFNNGKFLAVNFSVVYTSADGKTWTNAGAPSTDIDDDTRFVSVNNTLYAAGILGFYTSTDAINWTSIDVPVFGMSDLVQGGGKYVGVTSYGAIVTGPDAAHLAIVVKPTEGYLGAGLYAHGRYMWTAGIGLFTSTDGKAWSQTDFAPGNGLVFSRTDGEVSNNGMAVAPDGTVVVSGELELPDGTRTVNSATFAWSSDGTTWQFASPQGDTPTSNDNGAGPVIHDGTRFLSIGSRTGYIHTSPDGHTWTTAGRITLPSGVGVGGLVFANGKYVVVGGNGFTATSTDGLNWAIAATKVSSPGPTSTVLHMDSVVYVAGRFVAAGSDAVAATSTDGITWTAVATAAPLTNADGIPAQITGMAVDATGEIVAVGYESLVETSRDGVHWTLRQTGRHEQFLGVAVTPTGFMIGADNDSVMFSAN